jgi:hypothetical protein
LITPLQNFGADPSILSTKGEFIGKSAYEVANSSAQETFHVYIFEQIAMGHLASIELLIKGRVPIDICDDSESRDSLLHWACSFDQFQVAELLLKHDMKVDICNAHGQSCLHVACKSGKVNFIDFLLDHGANIYLKDSSGKTPVDLIPPGFPVNPRLLHPTEDHKTVVSTPREVDQHLPLSVEAIHIEDSIISDDDSGYDTDTSNAIHRSKHLNNAHLKTAPIKQLILWPPVQRQIQYSNDQQSFLIFSNETPIIICAASDDIDIYPLLTWSGLVDTLNTLGLQTFVHRSTPSGKIRLSIDPIVCPGRHRFEITISTPLSPPPPSFPYF